RLAAYAWPGNVRELRNIIERASLLRQGDTIRPADLLVTAPAQPPPDAPASVIKPVAKDIVPLEELTKQHILRALDACSGNKSQAAKCLRLPLSTLKRKIKSFT
ncbi:MAG: helix-turn-helix domain-containing protein, partial [Desulfatitalea sp.]